MPKYLIETTSTFKIRYVIGTDSSEGISEEEIKNIFLEDQDNIKEFSQKHLGEEVVSIAEITDTEYLERFDEDNDYLSEWSEYMKLGFVNWR